jgi:hypothetical protein
LFHDALRDRVSDGVDLGEDIVEGRDIIFPSLVKSGFNLLLSFLSYPIDPAGPQPVSIQTRVD